MISNEITAADIIRLYVWATLEINQTIDLIDGRVPIVPLGEQPVLSDAHKPYLIYGYAEQDGENSTNIKRGVINFRVVGYTYSNISKILNTIKLEFQNEDANAEKINLYTSNYQLVDLKGIRFTYLCVSSTDGGIPSDTEGGPVEGMISIEYRYITHQSVQSPVSGGLWS